ncbi:uncharacterized protein LOC123720414 [Pieris brassicae]|uniref:uncharacterized protein LOC123720414 n=1 Tax=Pieris brassicae TaxID=7116 RepID=UPI001E65ED51|nr:uncharacterized protein LOC123720414 [Pieris brassicae]
MKIQMWFFISRLLLLVLLKPVWILSKETIIIRTSEEQKQNAFVDVLKNITSANQILQDLIKNYEQLQKIYKSGDESFNDNSENEHGNFKALSSEDDKQTTKGYGITQIIYVGETEESSEEQPPGNKYNGSNIIAVESDDMEEFNETDKDSSGVGDETEIVLQKPQNIEENTTSPRQKDHKTPRLNTETYKIDPHLYSRNKTRFSIKHKDAKRHFDRPNLRQKDDKAIKRIVYAEVFSPDKIWHEIVHKPIELKIYEDHANFRTPNNNKAISNIHAKTSGTGKDLSDSPLESNPDDVIEKEEIKSMLLREAYGNACVQVAVRKCYKALKAVRKSVCRLRLKCKNSLKGSFIENAKKGCIREFVNGKNKPDDKEAQEIIFERTINKSDGTDLSKYVDLCLPHLRSKTTSNEFLKGAKEFKNINILRDKFEKACKKLSAKKCGKACKFAYNTACSIHSCENSLKKAFKKGCNAECKTAYNLYKESSYSDDDDESESD